MQPTVTSKDGTRTFRSRQHGNRALPLSPLLDPIAIDAKEKHTRPKPFRLEGDRTDFQKELEANPFARALATKVRECALTKVRLPKHFLLPVVSYLEPPSEEEHGKRQQTQVHVRPDFDLEVPPHLRSRSRTYVLAKRDIITLLTGRSKWPAVVSERMKRWAGLKLGRQWSALKPKQDFKWHEETDEQVLQALRAQVVRKLNDAWDRGDIVASIELEGKDTACLLHFEGEAEQTTQKNECGEESVYDMNALLGDEKWQARCVGHRMAGTVAVVQSSRVTSLRTALLRLTDYIGKEES